MKSSINIKHYIYKLHTNFQSIKRLIKVIQKENYFKFFFKIHETLISLLTKKFSIIYLMNQNTSDYYLVLSFWKMGNP